jgi:hypothetical protein
MKPANAASSSSGMRSQLRSSDRLASSEVKVATATG